jgi:ABC-type Na+ efflux pump permease subunit
MRLLVLPAILVAAVAIAACGSSKPSYCDDRSNLESSVKDLGNVDIGSGGLSALEDQLKKVDSDAKALASSAKSDFPSETQAISSSVDALDSSLQGISSSPSAEQIATLTKDVAAVVTSVGNFEDATKSKCD